MEKINPSYQPIPTSESQQNSPRPSGERTRGHQHTVGSASESVVRREARPTVPFAQMSGGGKAYAIGTVTMSLVASALFAYFTARNWGKPVPVGIEIFNALGTQAFVIVACIAMLKINAQSEAEKLASGELEGPERLMEKGMASGIEEESGVQEEMSEKMASTIQETVDEYAPLLKTMLKDPSYGAAASPDAARQEVSLGKKPVALNQVPSTDRDTENSASVQSLLKNPGLQQAFQQMEAPDTVKQNLESARQDMENNGSTVGELEQRLSKLKAFAERMQAAEEETEQPSSSKKSKERVAIMEGE